MSMSRRRQRDRQVIEQQLQEAPESRGPCPGRCNAARRRWLRRWESVVASARDQLLLEFGSEHAGAQWLQAEAEQLADSEVTVPEARPGRPVWCFRCVSEIRMALDRLPRLLLLTLETGEAPARRPPREGQRVLGLTGDLVATPVVVLDVGTGGDEWRVTESLACGHRHTRGQGPHAPWQRRVCLTCVAAAMVPEPGRLAPGERAARRGGRQRRVVSPAGSPAWLEADAAIQWVCSSADQVAYLLGVVARDAGGVVERWPWREVVSHEARIRMAAAAARFLARRLEAVLELPDPIPGSVGRGALGVAGRLETVSGMKLTVHRLEDECPRCDRRGLEREDGSSYVRCRRCDSWWDESHFAHLARAAAAGGGV